VAAGEGARTVAHLGYVSGYKSNRLNPQSSTLAADYANFQKTLDAYRVPKMAA